MTTSSLLGNARKLLTPGLVLRQTGLAALIFVLFAIWLRVPDSRVVAVIGSTLLGLAVLLIAFAGETALLMHLRGRVRTRRALLLSAAVLLLCVALLFGWSHVLDRISNGDELRAGYLNSRFPASLRNVFSYPHMLAIFHALWVALFWIGAAFFFVCGVSFAAAAYPGRAIRACLRSATVWLTLLLSAAVALLATEHLSNWTPGHGLAVESLSLLLRLGVIVALDAVLLCFSICVVVARGRGSDELYAPAATVAGTPDLSHSRTAPAP